MNQIEFKNFIDDYKKKGGYHYNLKGFQDWFIRWNYKLLVNFLQGKSGRILDLACGDGRLEHIYNKLNIVGIDFSYEALTYANKWNKESYFVCADVRTLPLKDNSFDAVISSLSLQYLSEKDFVRTLLEVKRILKGNGRFIFSHINPEQYLNRKHVRQIEKNNKCLIHVLVREDICQTLSKHGFTIKKIAGTNIPLDYKNIPSLFRKVVFDLSKIGYFIPKLSYHHVYYTVLEERWS